MSQFNINDYLSDRFTSRHLQVYRWLLEEAPSEDILKILVSSLEKNIKKISERKEEHLEPTILRVTYFIRLEESKSKTFIKKISEELDRYYGVSVKPRTVSRILEQNSIERHRSNKGIYITVSAENVAKKLVLLGFNHPQNDALSSPSTRVFGGNNEF